MTEFLTQEEARGLIVKALDNEAELARQDADAIASFTEELLAWMMVAEVNNRYNRHSFVPTHYFEDACPLVGRDVLLEHHPDKRLISVLYPEEQKLDPDNFRYGDDTAEHILWGITPDLFGNEKIRTCNVQRADKELQEEKGEVYQFSSLWECDKKESLAWNKVLAPFGPPNFKEGSRNYIFAAEYIDKNGDRRSELERFRWSHATGTQILGRSDKDGLFRGAFERKLTDALESRYHWSLSIRTHEDRTGLKLYTDCPGMSELMVQRDKPDGARKRSALLHWVREHWRQTRKVSPKEEVLVREHLRGAKRFRVGNLLCEIKASSLDLERLARAKAAKPRPRRVGA